MKTATLCIALLFGALSYAQTKIKSGFPNIVPLGKIYNNSGKVTFTANPSSYDYYSSDLFIEWYSPNGPLIDTGVSFSTIIEEGFNEYYFRYVSRGNSGYPQVSGLDTIYLFVPPDPRSCYRESAIVRPALAGLPYTCKDPISFHELVETSDSLMEVAMLDRMKHPRFQNSKFDINNHYIFTGWNSEAVIILDNDPERQIRACYSSLDEIGLHSADFVEHYSSTLYLNEKHTQNWIGGSNKDTITWAKVFRYNQGMIEPSVSQSHYDIFSNYPSDCDLRQVLLSKPDTLIIIGPKKTRGNLSFDSYEWFPKTGLDDPYSLNPTLDLNVVNWDLFDGNATIYTLQITNSQDQSLRNYCSKIVKGNPEMLGVSELPKENIEVSIYPNPARNTVYFDGLENRLVKVSLFNMMGQLVLNEDHQGKILNLPSLDAGIYLINVTDKNQILLSKKLIIQQ